tara:strand:+ start:208 stop:534 length:327 start_codon:yes stop_codon:yes gene_type:complete
MKLVKIFVSILLILALVFFLTQNAGEDSRVYLNLLFKEYKSIPVSMIILGSLTIGLLAGYAVAVFSVLSSKAEVHSLQNKNRKLTEELNNLRNVAIDEGIYDTEDGEY